MYGSGNSEARRLRTLQGGRLRSEKGLDEAELLPDNGENDCKGNTKRCFLAGSYQFVVNTVGKIFSNDIYCFISN